MKHIAIKLWLGMMMLVGFALLLLWLFQIVFLKEYYISQQEEQLFNQGKEFVTIIENETNLNNGELSIASVEEEMTSFAYINHVFIEIRNIEGNFIFKESGTTEQQSQNMFNKLINEAIRGASEGKLVKTAVRHPRFGNTYLLIGIPIGESGVFIMNAPLPPVEATSEILAKQLIYISIIMILVGSLIAFVISRHFTRPIKMLGKATDEIAKGNFNISVEEKRKDEIGRLSKDIKNMANELEKTDILRKELIGNISHELRTPLTLIQGYAETIRDISGDNREKRNKQLDMIIDASDRLKCLIEDVLSLSKIEAGLIKLQREPLYIKEILDKVTEAFALLAEKKQINLEIKDIDDIMIFADKQAMEQVFYNLIGNAFKFTEEKGSVCVFAEIDKGLVKIIVEDNGIGMEKEEVANIWERYYKGEDSNSAGTGLGLAIVKGILEAHNYKYGVLSEKGKGTKIWIETEVYKEGIQI